jgi:hypothetical protein
MPRTSRQESFDVVSATVVALAPLMQPHKIAMADREQVRKAAERAAEKAGRYGDFQYAWKLMRRCEAELKALGLMNSQDRLNFALMRFNLHNIVRRLAGWPAQRPGKRLAEFMSQTTFVPNLKR